MNRAWAILVFLLIFIAAILRLVGIFDDFWLDEIWSLRILRHFGRSWHVLTHPQAFYDNNHPLNTWLMFLQGFHLGWRLYRVPALIAGAASVVVAAIILYRRGRTETIVGVLLLGFSYPLIVFSSEARGYALAVLCGLLALDAIERYLHSKGWIANAVFILACILGFASHLTFFYLYAGTAAWSLVRLVRQGHGGGSVLWHMLRLHLLPIAGLGFLYVIFVRHLTIGGAPRQPIMEALPRAIGALFGAGDSYGAAIVLIVVVAALLGMMLLTLRKHGNDLWIFLITVVIMPVIVVGMQVALSAQGQPILHRYFLVPYVFFLLGLALLLSHWLRRRDARRIGAAALLGAFLVINIYHTVRFLQVGRGSYLAAVQRMATYAPHGTPPPVIVVSSDHPARTGWVLEYYGHFIPPPQQLVIYDDSNFPRLAPRTHGPPMWIIIHSFRRGEPPAETIGGEYLFDQEFPYYGLSGYSWYLYRHRALG